MGSVASVEVSVGSVESVESVIICGICGFWFAGPPVASAWDTVVYSSETANSQSPVGRLPSIKLHMTFIPRGMHCNRPTWDFDCALRPWDVFFSPELYPCSYDEDSKRRKNQTKRLMQVVPRWGDFYPDLVCGEPQDDPKARDIVHACRKLGKNRVAPDEIIKLRYHGNPV